MRISVFGLGPVGLVTAVSFCKKGYSVVGVDTDSHRVELIRSGDAPFFEPSLETSLKEALDNGLLKTTSDSSVNTESDMSYITVGTPSSPDGSIDLTYIRGVASAIGKTLLSRKEYHLVLVKSTVTPGTARNVIKPILEKEAHKLVGQDFGLSSNPEFLREGKAMYDAEFPDRIIIGGESQSDLDNLEAFYNEVYGANTPTVIKTTYENAELIKYASNSFLAIKVSYINMIANLCQKVKGGDVEHVAKGIGLDKRIGSLFLRAGLGWGGSCFLKDLKAISAYGNFIDVKTALVDAAITVNENQPLKAVELVERHIGDLKGKKIALLGLAFKPDTDDLREAVSIPIIAALLEKGAQVVGYDPAAMPNAKILLRDKIQFATSPVDCIRDTDCCVIVTEWDEFKKISPTVFLETMRRPIVVDGRRIYDPSAFRQAGVSFSAIGLGES
ncbi:MAG: UDP-glucose dehydrogenase family protein [Candidatus Bathyarchaeia archaeon]